MRTLLDAVTCSSLVKTVKSLAAPSTSNNKSNKCKQQAASDEHEDMEVDDNNALAHSQAGSTKASLLSCSVIVQNVAILLEKHGMRDQPDNLRMIIDALVETTGYSSAGSPRPEPLQDLLCIAKHSIAAHHAQLMILLLCRCCESSFFPSSAGSAAHQAWQCQRVVCCCATADDAKHPWICRHLIQQQQRKACCMHQNMCSCLHQGGRQVMHTLLSIDCMSSRSGTQSQQS